jgi:hypothetical protein
VECDAVQHGEDGHRDAARNASFDASRVRVNFEWQNGAIAELSDLQVIDPDFCGNYGRRGRLDSNRLAMLDGEYFAKPSDGASYG